MAEITPYRQQHLPNEMVQGRSANANDFGGLVADQFGAMSNNLNHLSGVLEQKQKEEAARQSNFAASKQALDGHIYWDQRLDEIQKGIPQNDIPAAQKYVGGITAQVNEEFNNWALESIKSMPDEQSRDTMTLHLSRLKAGVLGSARHIEATHSGALAVASIKGSLDSAEALVATKWGQTNAMIQQTTDTIRNLNLPAEKKEELIRSNAQRLSEVGLHGFVQQLAVDASNPQNPKEVFTGVIDDLKSGNFALSSDGTGPTLQADGPHVQAAIHDIQKILDTKDAVDTRIQKDDLRQKIDNTQAGNMRSGLKLEDADFIQDPAERELVRRDISKALATGETVGSVKGKTIYEMDAMIQGDKAAVESNPTENDKYASVLSTRIKAAQQEVKLQQDDIALYAMNTSPAVKAAYDLISKEGANPTQGEVDNYWRTAKAEQMRINPTVAPAFMPKANLDAIVNDISSGLRSGKDPSADIRKQAERYGSAWPTILGQIGDKLPAEIAVMSSGILPDVVVNQLGQLAPLKIEELRASVKDVATDFDSSVAKALQPLTKTLAGLQDGDANAVQWVTAAKKLALSRMANGTDQEDAIASVYKDITANQIVSDHEWRIPRSAGIEDDAVVNATDAIRSRISELDLPVPGYRGVDDPELKRQWITNLREHGKFKTNKDDSGLALYYTSDTGALTVVRDRLGLPISYSWKELKEENPDPRAYQMRVN
jgi:hypothetical protein